MLKNVEFFCTHFHVVVWSLCLLQGFFSDRKQEAGLVFSLTLISEPRQKAGLLPKGFEQDLVQLQVRFKAEFKPSQKRRC